MKNEARVWLDYADENLMVARLFLEQKLYNLNIPWVGFFQISNQMPTFACAA